MVTLMTMGFLHFCKIFLVVEKDGVAPSVGFADSSL